MSEAAKLFDQSGGAASGDKQDAVTSAGQTMMKLLLKNQVRFWFDGEAGRRTLTLWRRQVSGMMGGGGSSGGLSSLMGMAKQFM